LNLLTPANHAGEPALGSGSASPAALVPLRILLAEDTPANQKLIVSLLTKRGHVVEIAHNGREAVDLARQKRFDLVLMDVQMPIMDGFQATAAIRSMAEPAKAELPIVAMTAHAMRGDRERCLAAGMDAYVAKPVDSRKFIELVELLALQPRTYGFNSPITSQVTPQMQDDTSNKVVDVDGALERMGGDEQLFRDIVGMFFEDTVGLMAQVRRAIPAGNARELERGAHSIKGLLSTFGADTAVAVAQRLEQIGRSGALADAEPAVSTLEGELEKVKAALEPYQPQR
jgi:CheY-like chemotaxis protein